MYFIAALIQVFAPNLGTLIAGRCIQGLGVGILSMTVPILQCEIAPAHARGLFVSIEYICLNIGYAVSAWVGYGFFFAMPSEISWRGPYIVQAAIALVLIFWTFFLPETPRWLAQNGFQKEALITLADLHGAGNVSDPKILATYAEIVAAVEFEAHMGQASWRQLFTQYTRRCVVGITCQMFAQLNGINAILYFLPSNLTRAGFTISRSLLYSGACALVYCSGTIPAMFLIDKFGRRAFLLFGSLALAASLSIVGGLQYYADSLPLGSARVSAADAIFFGMSLFYLQAKHVLKLIPTRCLSILILLRCHLGPRPLAPRCRNLSSPCSRQGHVAQHGHQLAFQLHYRLHHSPAFQRYQCRLLFRPRRLLYHLCHRRLVHLS